MNIFAKAGRWIACLPVGVASGLLAADLTMGLLSPLGAYFFPLELLVLACAGVVHPLVGYHVGRTIAPSKSRLSRDLMLYPYAVVGYVSAFILVGQLWSGVTAGTFATSECWAQLFYYTGSAIGCLTLLHPPTPRAMEQHDEKKHPIVSTFDWSH